MNVFQAAPPNAQDITKLVSIWRLLVHDIVARVANSISPATSADPGSALSGHPFPRRMAIEKPLA